NGSNPINNPFVVTAPAEFTSTINVGTLAGTLSETFFGTLTSPNNSKVTFENMNPATPAGSPNSACPAGGVCQIYSARFAGATSYAYGGDVELKNNQTVANQLTR